MEIRNHSQQKIDHYILLKTIGAGSFARVKLAKHEITNCSVAVKVINKKILQNLQVKTKIVLLYQIKREIQLMRYFNHPNIVKQYQTFESEHHIYVIMEYVDGGELHDILMQKNKLSEAQALEYFIQILSAVEYCHSHLIAHRDIKLENILIDKCGLIKLVDFGLSNFLKDGKFLKTPCGSPNYAAPELLNGKYYSGSEVDVWSLGVILYALIVGNLPFTADSLSNLYQKIKAP